MPSKTRAKNAAIAAKWAALPKIPKELLDQFGQEPMTAEAIQDVSMAFKKALIERALGGELSHHLGYALANQPLHGTVGPVATSNTYVNGRHGQVAYFLGGERSRLGVPARAAETSAPLE